MWKVPDAPFRLSGICGRLPGMNAEVEIHQVSWATHERELSAIRFAVFVEEQGFAAEIELDGCDAECVHVLAKNAAREPIGTARMLPDGHIGRVAVLPAHRGRGIGSRMMEKLAEIAKNLGFQQVELSSQVHAIPFYERLGYQPVGEIYDEAGAPHRKMVKPVV